MPELVCNVRDLIDGDATEQVAGAAFSIIGYPAAQYSNIGVHVAGPDFPAATGRLDADGNATVDIDHTLDAAYHYEFRLDYHPSLFWLFQFLTRYPDGAGGFIDATGWTLAQHVTQFYATHPGGRIDVEYTPGPQGDPGVPTPESIIAGNNTITVTRPGDGTARLTAHVNTDDTITGDGSPGDPLHAEPGSTFDRDNLIAGANIALTPVGADKVRIGASGTISAVDQIARTAAAAAEATAEAAQVTATTANTRAGINQTAIEAVRASVPPQVYIRSTAPPNSLGDPADMALVFSGDPFAIQVYLRVAEGWSTMGLPSHTINQTAIYPLLRAILRAGSNVTIDEDDVNFRLTINGQAGGGGGGTTYTGEAPIDVSGTVISLDDLGVTSAKLGTGAVTGGKIGTGAVSAAKLGTGAVTGTKLGGGAVSEDKLAAAVRAKLNAAMGVTVVDTLPPLTAALDGRLFEITSTQQLVRIRGHSGADATADWTALPPNFAFGGGKTYQGARNARTDAPRMIPSSHVWYIRDTHNFITGDANERAIYYGPPQGFIGSKEDEAHATHDLTANGQIAAWALPANPSEFPYRASNWVAAVTTEWHPVVIGDPVAIARSIVDAAIPEGTTTVEFTRNDGTTKTIALPTASPDSLPIPSQLPNETLFAALDRIFIFDDGDDEWRTATLDAFRTYIIGALRNVVSTALSTARDTDRVILTTVSGNRYQAIEDFAARMADEGVLITAHEGNTDRWAKGKLPTDVVYTEDLPDPGPGPTPSAPEILYDNHDAATGLTIRNFGNSSQRTATEIQFTRLLTSDDAGKTLEIEAEWDGAGSVRRFFSASIPVDQWLRAASAPSSLTDTGVTDMWSFFTFRSLSTAFTTWGDGTIGIQRRVASGNEMMRWRYARSSGDPNWTNARIEIRMR